MKMIGMFIIVIAISFFVTLYINKPTQDLQKKVMACRFNWRYLQ
jgi:hypothetical protein